MFYVLLKNAADGATAATVGAWVIDARSSCQRIQIASSQTAAGELQRCRQLMPKVAES